MNYFVILRETSLLYSEAELVVIRSNRATSNSTVIYRIADNTKINWKNTISWQIWNHWNEQGVVKFSLTLIGEQPLPPKEKPMNQQRNASETERKVWVQFTKHVEELTSHKGNKQSKKQLSSSSTTSREELQSTAQKYDKKYLYKLRLQNNWRFSSTQQSKFLLPTDCSSFRGKITQATAASKQACALSKYFRWRTSERSKKVQSKFGLSLACI